MTRHQPSSLNSLGVRSMCVDCHLRLKTLENNKLTLPSILVISPLCDVCLYLTRKPEAFTQPFCDFLVANPTVFHVVDHFAAKLRDRGFVELSPRHDWAGDIRPGGHYYVTRNGSSLIAFSVGLSYRPGNGFAMVASHVDVITARLRPVSARPTCAGYLQLGVAPYSGSGLSETWWDRDLSIGGRVVLRDPSSGRTRTALVKLDWPIARIPTLAPHFGHPIMGSNNKETELVPIIGLHTSEDIFDENLVQPPQNDNSPLGTQQQQRRPKLEESLGPGDSFVHSQPAGLVRLIAGQLGLGPDELATIVNWELELYDSQPAQTGGINREFIFGGRIDDRLCSWAAVMGLLAADESRPDSVVRLVALFDNEEIGSLLRQGAHSNFLSSVVERVVEASCALPVPPSPTAGTTVSAQNPPSHPPVSFGPGLMGRTYARSFLVSADVTHAANPNFLRYYLDNHAPRLNNGIVLKTDGSGHTTTDARSDDVIRRVAHLAGLPPPQCFQARNDCRTGGTIGPMLSSALGVRAADVGLPQLSMHSIRATTGALDPGLGVQFFAAFFENWEQIDQEWH